VMERLDGTPQGGPLSPLLANLLLDEVDKELEKRGHAFVRYADDCNVYVRSRRAGERVMTWSRNCGATPFRWTVLPSAMRNEVRTPVAIISQLNTQPACAPVNASSAALRLPTHDSGSGWLATLFLCDSFIHNSTPVYPGALRNLLDMSHVSGNGLGEIDG
jgi:reverse transcriptase-like protein